MLSIVPGAVLGTALVALDGASDDALGTVLGAAVWCTLTVFEDDEFVPPLLPLKVFFVVPVDLADSVVVDLDAADFVTDVFVPARARDRIQGDERGRSSVRAFTVR